jgi:hypothetical protein
MLTTNASFLLLSWWPHSTPDRRRSPASPATTGTRPRHTNAGKKHSPSGPAINTPARSAAAAATCAESARDRSASPATPAASAAPEDAERRASRSNASVCASTWPAGRSGAADHATAGSAPRASKSAARRSTRASPGGADAAVAPAAVDTAMPADRHTTRTSRLDATASRSGPPACVFRGRRARGDIPARDRTTAGPGPIHKATARSSADVLTGRPDR